MLPVLLSLLALIIQSEGTVRDMAITQVGLVYYEDDPEKKIFRKVYPEVDDVELNAPCFTTDGVDSRRKAILIKVPADSPEALANMTGTP